MKGKTSYDEDWCGHCQADTRQHFLSIEQGSKSSGDCQTCIACGWFRLGHSSEWTPPTIEGGNRSKRVGKKPRGADPKSWDPLFKSAEGNSPLPGGMLAATTLRARSDGANATKRDVCHSCGVGEFCDVPTCSHCGEMALDGPTTRAMKTYLLREFAKRRAAHSIVRAASGEEAVVWRETDGDISAKLGNLTLGVDPTELGGYWTWCVSCDDWIVNSVAAFGNIAAAKSEAEKFARKIVK